jgi:hypothetical protein
VVVKSRVVLSRRVGTADSAVSPTKSVVEGSMSVMREVVE